MFINRFTNYKNFKVYFVVRRILYVSFLPKSTYSFPSVKGILAIFPFFRQGPVIKPFIVASEYNITCVVELRLANLFLITILIR